MRSVAIIGKNYNYFRLYSKQEIDFKKEKDGLYSAFEFKYNVKKGKSKCPLTFSKNYPDIPFTVITKDNYTDFITV